jgi:membrane protease YdiL (CAAX protease family)
VLYLKTDAVAERHAPGDLLAEGGSVRMTAATPIALRAEGPFEPLASAIETTSALRDELAAQIPIPSLRGYKRIRLGLLAACTPPMAMLIELDRELVTHQHTGVGRVLIDLVLIAFVIFELSRRTPRLPSVCAMALVAVGLRWGLVAARLCGSGVHPLVYGAAGLCFVAAGVLLVRVPSRSRVALELAGKLGITRSDLFAATQSREPPTALVAAAIASAAGLPAILHLARMAGAGMAIQALVFVGFAAIAPVVARRTIEPDAGTRSSEPKRIAPVRIVLGFTAGLALSAAAVTAGRLVFEAGTEIARCVERLDTEAKMARAAEAAELARAIAKVRAETALVIMTTAIFPFAEERIYRGLLQDVLTRKYGRSYGVFAASIAFGLVHIGIYHVALYQTVLLGIGFGIAYLEGGLLAAFLVHATWNLLQLG